MKIQAWFTVLGIRLQWRVYLAHHKILGKFPTVLIAVDGEVARTTGSRVGGSGKPFPCRGDGCRRSVRDAINMPRVKIFFTVCVSLLEQKNCFFLPGCLVAILVWIIQFRAYQALFWPRPITTLRTISAKPQEPVLFDDHLLSRNLT